MKTIRTNLSVKLLLTPADENIATYPSQQETILTSSL